MDPVIIMAIAIAGFYIYKKHKSNKVAAEMDKAEKKQEEELLEIDRVSPYKPRYILSANEYLFYNELKKITDMNNQIICPKVSLQEIFEVDDKTNFLIWYRRIAQKHIDFLVCDNQLRTLYVIELDDGSRNLNNENDRFKEDLFRISNIKMIRIKTQPEYSGEYILKDLKGNENEL